MRTTIALLGGLSLVGLSAPAMAQAPEPPGQVVMVQTQPVQAAPQILVESGAPSASTTTSPPPAPVAAPPPAPAQIPAPPQTGAVLEARPDAAAGQWVYTEETGYIWVPAGASTSDVEGVPYTYLYTPAYGWTWYASPWGVGPFVYGPWVGGVWPYGFHAWAYGPGGWGWRGAMPGYHGYGRAFGAPGHYYGYGGGNRPGVRVGGGAHFGGGGGFHGGGGGHGGGHR